MKVRLVITIVFVLLSVLVHSQTKRNEVYLNDSTHLYFFHLFNEERTMHWGTVPKNFPFQNYRVYLKNNSLDTLKVGRITTGDGRVTYHYSSPTKIIYPEEYVVLKPLHNGTQIRGRHGRFSKSVQITLTSEDTTYVVYHLYKGEFSKDTVLPNFRRNKPDESLLPKRKPEELEADRMYVAQTHKKLEALGKVRTNYIYVIYKDSIFVEANKVFSRTAWRQAEMPLEMKGIPHYLFHLYGNEQMVRIELVGVHDQRIHLELDSDKGSYICANFNGVTEYFSTQEACEKYIKRLLKKN